MFSFPRFPTVELPTFELTNFSQFDLSKIDLPRIDLPGVELPSVDARDVAYIVVGLAVLTAERQQALQAQLTEMPKAQLASAVAKVRTAV